MNILRYMSIPVRLYRKYHYHKIFGHIGRKSSVDSPLRLQGPENIYIGDNVGVHYKTWLAALPLTQMGGVKLLISDGCVIGDFNHIWATHSITFEKNVLTANHVYVSDNLHCYADIETPIVKQPIKQLRDVVIGEGSWLGENVCVIGASIGKHCVIGANSVVTHDIPDYCVAVGSPAKVIKQYNFNSKQWEKV